MNTDIDELKLTAYAVGELDEAERPAVEAHLAADAAARRHVEEVRATAQLLAGELARAAGGDDADYRLTALQHAAIERRLAGGAREPVRSGEPVRLPGRNWAMWGSLAASVAIVATVTATVVVPLLNLGGTGNGHAGRPGASGTDGGPTGVGPIITLPDGPLPGTAGDTSEWPPLVDAPIPGSAARGGEPEGDFVRVADHPLSAFPPSPIYPDDVEKGSFALVRRSLQRGELPPAGVMRTDDLINAFAYHYDAPKPGDTVGASVEVAACPWDATHRLVRIGLRAADGPTTKPAGGAPDLVARDVSIRVEFNPALAAAYRLIGYEPGLPIPSHTGPGTDGGSSIDTLAPGRTVTALYEVVPAGQPVPAARAADPAPALKYQKVTVVPTGGTELLTATVSYRDAGGGPYRTIEHALADDDRAFDAASDDFRTAAAAAAFGLLLRDSPHKGAATYDLVIDTATRAASATADRKVLADLAARAKALAQPATQPAR